MRIRIKMEVIMPYFWNFETKVSLLEINELHPYIPRDPQSEVNRWKKEQK